MDRIGFGAFLSPLHPLGEDPSLSLWRDLELAEWLDQLGYDELWVGEHHSAGWGTISSPELFIATAAERTRHIRLGTGVVSLPYHHPFMVASRAVQLDQLTRGRFTLGVGAGSIPTDMHLLGIDPADTRRRTAEALDVIHKLLHDTVPVTVRTDWFEVRDARLQLRPHSPAGLPMAVSSAVSPFGMRLAGQYGISPISFGIPPRPGSRIGDLVGQWQHAEAAAAEHGRKLDRGDWRVALSVHVSDSREQALDEIVDGWMRYRNEYWALLGAPRVHSRAEARKALEELIDRRGSVIGSVDDCVQAIRDVQDETGGFGRLLVTVLDWADRSALKRSFELLARFVAPKFNGSLGGVTESYGRAVSKALELAAR
ncbi:LLM class flavin-dependent oxidoreductase [Actinosynnema sp. NPDC047251]|uniref:Limonene 1,2-monooxygenase n=1 Tax=Saccharothrix espanaensis (strain ATCC 51144 / DSM 44229 / JCM 9112 / NBRC 15066 / NRRL 15764) TaxID=1179773 RepID=K0JYW8_SACES|nr:LLM class flavin-dependent oxidoreductase [Saccharothrix espanaensis]CCH29453.1 Limonene 1,2-monooxygenase [Saccharothrix espanaensis DSM 44229]